MMERPPIDINGCWKTVIMAELATEPGQLTGLKSNHGSRRGTCG